jgi:hypothetical protein
VKGNVYLDLADKNRGRQNVLGGSGIFRFNSCGQASGNQNILVMQPLQ